MGPLVGMRGWGSGEYEGVGPLVSMRGWGITSHIFSVYT